MIYRYFISTYFSYNSTIFSDVFFFYITQAHKKKRGMNFTCDYTTPIDFEPLNPNPVSEFPLDPPVFP